jgi:hypothetical protein
MKENPATQPLSDRHCTNSVPLSLYCASCPFLALLERYQRRGERERKERALFWNGTFEMNAGTQFKAQMERWNTSQMENWNCLTNHDSQGHGAALESQHRAQVEHSGGTVWNRLRMNVPAQYWPRTGRERCKQRGATCTYTYCSSQC